MQAPLIAVVMGVSGAGKSTLGQALAQRLGWDFADGDDFHPEANVQKMARGEALTDADRWPWLQRLRGFIDLRLVDQDPVVLACSALKRSYRHRLGCERPAVQLIYLHGAYEPLLRRMQARQGHFMPPSQLRDQLDTLEVPTALEAHWLLIDRPVQEQVDALLPLFTA